MRSLIVRSFVGWGHYLFYHSDINLDISPYHKIIHKLKIWFPPPVHCCSPVCVWWFPPAPVPVWVGRPSPALDGHVPPASPPVAPWSSAVVALSPAVSCAVWPDIGRLGCRGRWSPLWWDKQMFYTFTYTSGHWEKMEKRTRGLTLGVKRIKSLQVLSVCENLSC